jgi:hypothetical protein
MATTETPSTMHLQGVGRVPAVEASELRVGDQLMYNGGSVYEIVKIEDASAKFFKIFEVSTATGEESSRRVKKDRLAARVPDKHRRPLGFYAAPRTEYRAQIKPPTGDLGWITVGHGATIKDAVSGLTPSYDVPTYFANAMLDRHGLGWTVDNPNGRADSLKAMTEGETLTAADGHSFRILPPEQAAASCGWTDADAYHLDIIDTDGTVYAHKDVNRQEAERLAAHETRTGTTRDDANGVITVHGLSTNMGPRTHVLTPQRPGAEWPCMVAEEPTAAREEAPARPAAEGTVIPAGHTLGIHVDHADSPDARDAAAALIAAGHTPALLSGRFDDNDTEFARGTGFMIQVRRDGRVMVYHLVDGVDSWNSMGDDDRRAVLRTYRDTLRAAGWESDGRIFRCVQAWRTSPLPEGVTLAQTRGEAPTEEDLPVSAAEIVAEFGPQALEEGRQMAREVFAEVAAESEKEQQAARTLPTLEGHTITATLKGSLWTVALYADGNDEPLHTDKIGDHVDDGPAYAARELIRVRTAALEEKAALLALDDETLYEVCEYRASTPTGEPVTMTGRDARARLTAAREEAGPEKPHGRNTPRLTLEHSGAHWWATLHAYSTAGHRDQWNRRHIAVRPLVVARAAHAITEYTGDGCISPVEKPGIQAYGPWVRPVEGRADMVTVNRVSSGLVQRPEHEPASTRWDEWTQAYREALEGSGWVLVNPRAEWADGGAVFLAPEHTA